MIANIQENSTINQGELVKLLGISRPTFNKHKDTILLELSDAWEYEVEYSGPSIKYHFIKKHYDYEYKKMTERMVTERDNDYKQAIVEEITERPLNTAANVARVIENDWPEIKDKYQYTSGYNYEIVRSRMRQWFGKSENDNGCFEEDRIGYIREKVWCRLDAEHNMYVPMTDTHIQQFYTLVSEAFELCRKDEVQLFEDRLNGLITENALSQELKELKFNTYLGVKKTFKEKFGFTPIKVPYYCVFAKEDDCAVGSEE